MGTFEFPINKPTKESVNSKALREAVLESRDISEEEKSEFLKKSNGNKNKK